MKNLILLVTVVSLTFASCKKEKDPINSATPQTTSSNMKTFKVVVTASAAGGGAKPFTVNYKPTDSTGNYEWTENGTSGTTFERNVQAQKDSTMMVFVHGDFSTLFLFNVKVYEGSTVVKDFSKSCTHTGVTYTVQ